MLHLRGRKKVERNSLNDLFTTLIPSVGSQEAPEQLNSTTLAGPRSKLPVNGVHKQPDVCLIAATGSD